MAKMKQNQHCDLEGLNSGYWHWWVSGLAIPSIAACFSCPNVHTVKPFLLKLALSGLTKV